VTSDKASTNGLGGRRLPVGIDLLHDPKLNKGTAFTASERNALKLRGLLPPHVFTQEEQQIRILENLRVKPSDLEKYIFMMSLQDRNETAFYRTLIDNVEEMLPIVYTPTVGEASRRFGHIFRRPKGLYVTCEDRGKIEEVLRNWPVEHVAIIVVTDGERILGLGDLGANGMGIPIGKLSLYTALAGVHPSCNLPVMLDVGTDNEELLKDPLYIGLARRRLRGQEYDELVEEFVSGVQKVFPGALIQFEDFATRNAIELLERYRERVCTFNDDIQGTAAVVLAGLLGAGRITGRPLGDEKLLFLGAGSAATGIANLIVSAMVRDGLREAEARRRCWFVDSRGLVVKARDDLASHKLPYAHDHESAPDLQAAVSSLRPTALIGVSGQPQTFTRPVLEEMAQINERPIVFALSNPTSKSECTAEQAYQWTEGRAVFASGSPFAPVELRETRYVPGQGNNAYIFPGLGLGVIVAGASRVTDEMFHVAARTVADQVSDDLLSQGSVYPRLTVIRDVSARIAEAVALVAVEAGLASKELPQDLAGYVRSQMYEPTYESYV
jgi:malate dehydrogenase (oxaloacetate-decarboxylating)(NADP+)